MAHGIEINEWGIINDQKVYLYTFTNKNGTKASFSNIGAAIQSVFVKGKNKVFEDVVLGYDTASAYADDPFYIGTVVGRYANRIAGGEVEIEGKTYQLTLNGNGFHHHGGKEGFNKKAWHAVPFQKKEGKGVVFSLLSPDGEEGFPGNLQVKIRYTLTDSDEIIVDFWAETDQSTPINLTQHVYFNLGGQNNGSILDHDLMINAEHYLPVNDKIVPTGQLADVGCTPFDFRQSKTIGRDIGIDNGQLNLGAGYDHSWVLKPHRSDELKLAAKVIENKSGRVLTVYTTEPAVHLYTGNFLEASVPGKDNKSYQPRDGFCLETQNYPDAPNHPHFPGTILPKGEIFESKTIFEFGLLPKYL